MAASIQTMMEAYQKHWEDGINEGEELSEGCIRDCLMISAEQLKSALGESSWLYPDAIGSKKVRRKIAGSGLRCSDPSCPAKPDGVLSPSTVAVRPELLQKCSRCRLGACCSRSCQLEHWPSHKKHCKKKWITSIRTLCRWLRQIDEDWLRL